jgi:hypothetical protein
MNSPHSHPRASEINFSLNTTLRGGVLVENGARFANFFFFFRMRSGSLTLRRFAEIDIRPGTATVFPQGAIHFEMNPSCEKVPARLCSLCAILTMRKGDVCGCL